MSRYAPARPVTPRRFRCSTIPERPILKRSASIPRDSHPTQEDGQGPDLGPQYRSGIFYLDPEQKKTAEKLLEVLRGKGYEVVTEVSAFKRFWNAEGYHQDYYQKTGKAPYCHSYQKRF